MFGSDQSPIDVNNPMMTMLLNKRDTHLNKTVEMATNMATIIIAKTTPTIIPMSFLLLSLLFDAAITMTTFH